MEFYSLHFYAVFANRALETAKPSSNPAARAACSRWATPFAFSAASLAQSSARNSTNPFGIVFVVAFILSLLASFIHIHLIFKLPGQWHLAHSFTLECDIALFQVGVCHHRLSARCPDSAIHYAV
jgi:uncharacterized protein (DUF58 family)